MRLCEEIEKEEEFEDGVRREGVICHSIVPITTEHERASEGLKDISEDYIGRIVEIPLFQKSVIINQLRESEDQNKESTEESTENEKSTIVRSFGPTLTRSEEINLEARNHIKAYILENKLPGKKAIARAAKLMSKKMCLEDDGKLWRTTRNGMRVEVLDIKERLRDMLIMNHDGMGHRAMGSCYALFQQKFWVLGASATKDASPEAAADCIYTHIVTRYGCPISLYFDHGDHFVNPIIRALCRILKIYHHFSTPYYPQSNGKIE